MPTEHSQVLYSLVLVAFLITAVMQAVRKNSTLVLAYALQSLTLVGVLLYLAAQSSVGISAVLAATALLTAVVKILLTPRLLSRLIAQHSLTNTSTTYLNLPLTLIMTIVLVAFAHSHVLGGLVPLLSSTRDAFSLAVATMLLSLVLLVNRKGALSQVVGILSLENSVVMCAAFVGLEQSLGFEIGISFDLVVWVTIATFFVSLVYRHFGTLDVTEVNRLID